jgi:hypothetical protein
MSIGPNPNEILVRGDGAVDQHHRCRRVAVIADRPAAEIEQHDVDLGGERKGKALEELKTLTADEPWLEWATDGLPS